MTQLRVLVVEDDAIIAAHLAQVLQHTNIEVPALVASGEELLEGLDRWKPDVLVLDIRLRGKMNGFDAGMEAYRRLQTPIVFLSAFSIAASSNLQPGKPFAYLNKPVREEDLFKAIKSVLYRKELIRRNVPESLMDKTVRKMAAALDGIEVDREFFFQALREWKD